jgi:hypothetical protein
MPVRYLCCQCDADVTDAVKQECEEDPSVVPMLTFKGMNVVHAARLVTVTCPNNHTCNYPCGGSHHE